MNLDQIHSIPQHRICLVNIDQILDSASHKVLDSINWYARIDKDYTLNKPVKLFITHFIIHEICEFVLHHKTNNKIIFFVSPKLNSKLHYYFDTDELDKLIKSVLMKIHKLLPIRLYFGKVSYIGFISEQEENTGFFQTQLQELKVIVSTEYKKYTFSRIKKYAEDKGLKFLNEEYFNNIKSGQLIFC
jgi:hypothetical protein